MVLRPSRPEDAETGQFNARYPLPTEIMGAIMNGATPDNTAISAAVDADGDVHTMVLETGLGLYARYSRTWMRLTDLTPIENLNIVDIDPDDLNIYDEADSAGNMVNIADLHPSAPEAVEVIQSAEPAPAPMAASAHIVVASIDDVPRAVAYAATEAGAGSRWYVERRAKGFGWQGEIPWPSAAPVRGAAGEKKKKEEEGSGEGGGNPYHDEIGRFSSADSDSDGDGGKKEEKEEKPEFDEATLKFFGWFSKLSDQEKADFEKAFGKGGEEDDGTPARRKAAPRVEEDEVPIKSPGGAEIDDYVGKANGIGTYKDGWSYDGYGWRDKNGKATKHPPGRRLADD